MPSVLTLNGGSSSIRFAVYDARDASRKLLEGKLERIGTTGATLSMEGRTSAFDAGDHAEAMRSLLERLGSHPSFANVTAVGHRIVHGMQHSDPERITPALLDELRRIVAFDPEHMPREIELIEAVRAEHPVLPQVACFDTAFHRTMPRVATVVAIPRRYAAKGVQRYGFHGLSYTYLMAELRRLDGAAAGGRVVLAHLGSGASLAAVVDGRCIDTSMGFTPSSGIVMGTRTGDLDPGIMSFLALNERMDAASLQTLVNHESGLKGVSGMSADVRDLLEAEARDEHAAEAVALFCYQIKKCIGAYAAALGGIDTLVFAGGIGENSAVIRARVCAGLQFLGIALDETRNASGAALISQDPGLVAVRVIRTDEESVIARSTIDVLGLATTRNDP